jgi:arginine decarboxylase
MKLRRFFVKNRIPHEFFETKGIGESALEQHAGSYHMALYSAGIADYNIMTYSSVLPKDAELVDIDRVNEIPFGSELMTIMAVCHKEESALCSAGIVYAWMYDDSGEQVAGLVCEVSGGYPEDELTYRLEQVILELHMATYSHWKLGELRFIINSFIPQKRYGTALAALCFVSFKE